MSSIGERIGPVPSSGELVNSYRSTTFVMSDLPTRIRYCVSIQSGVTASVTSTPGLRSGRVFLI